METMTIFVPFILVPVCVVLGVLALLTLAFSKPLSRMIKRRWPKMARNMHLIVPITAFCVVAFMLASAMLSRGIYQQYWLNEPLCTAAGEGDTAKVERLLEQGASPDSWGIDFVDRAIVYATERGHGDVVALLIEHGADVNVRGRNGHTALYWAREEGYEDITRILIEAGAHAE